MTELIRSAKFGSDWTSHELATYNIVVEYQNAATFFGTDSLPQPTVIPTILTATSPDDAADDGDYYFLRTMDLAMSPAPAEESAVDDFAVLLLRALGYTPRGRVVRTRKEIPLIICGEARHMKTDVCIIDQNEIVLLVQEDKRHLDLASDPEPQLIAEAIAAFPANNRTRQRTLNQPPLNSKVMAGITMKGTAPIFYKIPVTAALAGSVASRVYPQVETIVHAHVPNVPRPNRRWSEGMKPLDNRKVILSCYEAFRQFVN